MSAMLQLVTKDLRLATDALRPLLVVIGGLLLGVAVLSLVPAATRPWGGGDIDLAFTVRSVGVLLLGFGAIFGAWTTAVILLGDRRHRAGALSATIPLGAGKRWLSRVVAFLACYAIVIGGSSAVQEPKPLVALGFGTLSWLFGTAMALVWMPAFGQGRATRVSAIVALSTVSVAILLVADVAAAVLGFEWIVAPLRAKGEQFILPFELGWEREPVVFGAVLVAALATSLTLMGLRMLGGRRLNRVGNALKAIGVAALLGSLTATGMATWSAGHDSNIRVANQLVEFAEDVPGLPDRSLVATLDTMANLPSHRWYIELQDPRSLGGMVLREVFRRMEAIDFSPGTDGYLQSELAVRFVKRARQPGNEGSVGSLRTYLANRSADFAAEFSLLHPLERTPPVTIDRGHAMTLLFRLLVEEHGETNGVREFDRWSRAHGADSSRYNEAMATELERFAQRGHRLSPQLTKIAAGLRVDATSWSRRMQEAPNPLHGEEGGPE